MEAAMEAGRSNDMIMDPTLWKAATNGDAQYIQNNKTLLLQVTIDGNSVLHIAAKRGCEEIARQVSEVQPDLLTLANKSGDTPLYLASAAGHPEIVNLLIHQHRQLTQHHRPSSGSVEEDVVMMATVANRIGNTALHAATIGGHLSVVERLLLAAPKLATMTNQAGVSALYMAAERKLPEIVEKILAVSAEEVSHEGPRGQTALHAAVLRSYEISKMILDKNPSCLKHQDASKSTPLHFASAGGDRCLAILQLLLQRDASAGYMQDEEGSAIIHTAASAGNLKMIKEILAHCPDALEQKNNKGRNFVHVAVENNRLKVVEYVLNSFPSAKELLNEQDQKGNTTLHLAVLARNLKMIRVLLRSRIVDFALKNNSGFTPVDLAFSKSGTEISIRMGNIIRELFSYGSRFCPQRLDHIRKKWPIREDEVLNRYYQALTNNLIIIAVLIATVTFAAAFTLPGGYKNDSGSDEGMAILSSRAAFKVFLISDTIAMSSSIILVVTLLYFGFSEYRAKQKYHRTALTLVWVAIGTLSVAFATGVYSVVAPDSGVAILVILIVCSVPFVIILLLKRHPSEYFWFGRNPVAGRNSISVDLKRLQKKFSESQILDDMEFTTPKTSPEAAII